ncbi:MAG TPA: alpha/beta hydrolase-fold protein [Anaerolineaceae bacterium]|nr:alpha/beta hydrolase-fold protein [Anaerolineaceae bacterium]
MSKSFLRWRQSIYYSCITLQVALLLFLTGCQPAVLSILEINPGLQPANQPNDAIQSSPIIPNTPTEKPTQTLTPTPYHSPTPTLTATPPKCSETQGRIEPHQINTELLPNPLAFLVYLPPCYTTTPAIRYPVLYFLHGMNEDDTQWVRIGATTTADQLISSGEEPPFLIVMPDEVNTAADVDDTGFGNALVKDLVPWIDQNYASCTDSICRAIGGLSRGSGWALRLGFINWQIFGAIGSHSISPFDGDYYLVPDWLKVIPPGQLPRLYMDIGSSDISLQNATQMEALFSKYNVPHAWHVFEGYHNEDYWSAHVADYLRWYALAWQAYDNSARAGN